MSYSDIQQLSSPRANISYRARHLQHVPSDAVILTQLIQCGRELNRVVCRGVGPDLLEDIEQLRLRHDVQPKSREVPTITRAMHSCQLRAVKKRGAVAAAALALVVAWDGQIGLRKLDRWLFHESSQRKKLLWGQWVGGGHGHRS